MKLKSLNPYILRLTVLGYALSGASSLWTAWIQDPYARGALPCFLLWVLLCRVPRDTTEREREPASLLVAAILLTFAGSVFAFEILTHLALALILLPSHTSLAHRVILLAGALSWLPALSVGHTHFTPGETLGLRILVLLGSLVTTLRPLASKRWSAS